MDLDEAKVIIHRSNPAEVVLPTGHVAPHNHLVHREVVETRRRAPGHCWGRMGRGMVAIDRRRAAGAGSRGW